MKITLNISKKKFSKNLENNIMFLINMKRTAFMKNKVWFRWI